jgi:hypothetical protein
VSRFRLQPDPDEGRCSGPAALRWQDQAFFADENPIAREGFCGTKTYLATLPFPTSSLSSIVPIFRSYPRVSRPYGERAEQYAAALN